MEQFHLPPGRLVGEMLEYVLEAQAAGEIQTTAEALALASRWLHEANYNQTLITPDPQ
jgi:hypothetical protein